jgi:ABC-type transport system substrate-binding protein
MKKTNLSYYNCLLKQRPDGTFEDVTAKAGLLGEHLDFNFGVAVGDYDNDGYEDLFICSAGRNALYHNNGNGTFTDVTAASGIGGKPPDTLSVAAAWFDYDNDGLLDLIVDNYTLLDPADRPALLHGRQRILLRSAALQERAAAALPQPGPRQVRGCHRKVRAGQVARQRHGHLHCGFQ